VYLEIQVSATFELVESQLASFIQLIVKIDNAVAKLCGNHGNNVGLSLYQASHFFDN
jgi:hypothetical protein